MNVSYEEIKQIDPSEVILMDEQCFEKFCELNPSFVNWFNKMQKTQKEKLCLEIKKISNRFRVQRNTLLLAEQSGSRVNCNDFAEITESEYECLIKKYKSYGFDDFIDGDLY